MEKLKGFDSIDFPYPNLDKVSDLVYYEGPILSHFKFDNTNLLYLWVDSNDMLNRWLVVEITEGILCSYLQQKISLRQIIHLSSSFILFTDIDAKLHHISNTLVLKPDIPSSYIPSENSFFSFPIPVIYSELISNRAYTANLIEKAIHIKIEEKIKRFEGVVKMENILSVFRNLKTSLTGYMEVNFKRDFKENDFDNYGRVLQTIKRESDFLMPNFTQGSFCASLSIDTLMSAETAPLIAEWRNRTFESFKKEVIELNYSADEMISTIISKYDNDERRVIYNPIVETLKDSNSYSISITDRSFNTIKSKLAPIPKASKTKLVPKRNITSEQQEEQILQMIAISKKQDDNSLKYSKRDIVEINELEEYTMSRVVNAIYYGNSALYLNSEFEYKVNYSKGDFSISYSEFSITSYGKTFASVNEQFFFKLIELYKYLVSINDTELSVDERKMKDGFISLVSYSAF